MQKLGRFSRRENAGVRHAVIAKLGNDPHNQEIAQC